MRQINNPVQFQLLYLSATFNRIKTNRKLRFLSITHLSHTGKLTMCTDEASEFLRTIHRLGCASKAAKSLQPSGAYAVLKANKHLPSIGYECMSQCTEEIK